MRGVGSRYSWQPAPLASATPEPHTPRDEEKEQDFNSCFGSVLRNGSRIGLPGAMSQRILCARFSAGEH